MGVKTREEYIESIRQMNSTAYMFGERLTKCKEVYFLL